MEFVIASNIVDDQKAISSLGNAIYICDLQIVKSFYPAIFGAMYSPYFIIVFCYWKINHTVEIYDVNNSRLAVFNWVDVKVSKTSFVTVVWFFTFLFPAHIMLTLVRFVAQYLLVIVLFFFLV